MDDRSIGRGCYGGLGWEETTVGWMGWMAVRLTTLQTVVGSMQWCRSTAH